MDIKQINFIHKGGPYGDETSWYEVKVPENTTFIDFVKGILLHRPKEWGAFKETNLFGPTIVEYSYGEYKIVDEEKYKEVQLKTIKKITANGGWSLMDYYIEFN